MVVRSRPFGNKAEVDRWPGWSCHVVGPWPLLRTVFCTFRSGNMHALWAAGPYPRQLALAVVELVGGTTPLGLLGRFFPIVVVVVVNDVAVLE